MRYTIPGIPKALPRYKEDADGQKPDYRQKEIRQRMRQALHEQHSGYSFYTTPIHLHVAFYFPLPCQLLQVDSKAYINKPHIDRPDLTNLIKLVEDVALGVLYEDDCIVAKITAVKCYSTDARTELTISIIEE